MTIGRAKEPKSQTNVDTFS